MQTKINIPYVNIASQHIPIKEELLEAVSEVFDEGKFVLSDKVCEFEKQFSSFCEVPYSLGVNSGTDALIFALRALEIGSSDEVITVSNSFISGASCIVLVGATPVFVDVRDDYTIDPELIEKEITEKTKAIIPVHLTGKPADMDAILAIAKKYNLVVIEDCAQAVGAIYKGKKVGSIGDVGCFSLHPLKTLNACGDGGVLTTKNSKLFEKVKMLRDNGFKSRGECVVWSNNSRLDSIQAAILLVKLKYLDEWINKRIENASCYQEGLKDMSQVKVPIENKEEKSVYHIFVVRVKNREGLQTYLKENGIKTAIHYPIPIHLQPVSQSLGYEKGSLPKTEEQSLEILSLPIYPELGKDNIEYILNCIRNFYIDDKEL